VIAVAAASLLNYFISRFIRGEAKQLTHEHSAARQARELRHRIAAQQATWADIYLWALVVSKRFTGKKVKLREGKRAIFSSLIMLESHECL